MERQQFEAFPDAHQLIDFARVDLRVDLDTALRHGLGHTAWDMTRKDRELYAEEIHP